MKMSELPEESNTPAQRTIAGIELMRMLLASITTTWTMNPGITL